jgi:hypothetical protein
MKIELVGHDGKSRRVEPTEASSPFGPLGDARLDGMLSVVHARHPIAGVSVSEGRIAFVFRKPVAWPLFAILEAAKPFQPRAAKWAKRFGSRGVRAFGLGAGVMDVELL